MKSIQSKIVLMMLAVVVSLCAVFGVLSCVLNYKTAGDVLELNMKEEARLAAEVVINSLENTRLIAEEAGCTARLTSEDATTETKQEIMNQKIETYGFIGGNILDDTGKSIFDGKDFSDRDYFQSSIKGESFISGPLISKITGEYSIMISAPIWEGGIPGTKVQGVIYFKPDIQILSDIVSLIKIGESGGAYLLNKDGLVIAHPEKENVCKENVLEEVKEDSSLKSVAAIEEDMVAGKSGYGEYAHEGATLTQAYTPVEGTDGWSIGVYAEKNEFMGNVLASIIITVILALAFITAGFIISKIAARKISLPIMQCAARIQKLSQGDLASSVPDIHTKDETGVLAESTKVLIEGLVDVIQDITYVMGEMAEGNLNVQSNGEYRGDFVPIQTATKKIISALNVTLAQISQSAESVSGGSEQVSGGAQALAQSSAEQASATEELAATVVEISDQVKITAENAGTANDQSIRASKEVENCNTRMQSLMDAMGEIREASEQINHIIKNIEDIASQTNLLSLNASIEAARAGEAGKGFTVVAQEVGALAADSAQAAKITTELIAATIQAVEKGTEIADDTAKALYEVVGETKHVSETVHQISAATSSQSDALEQVMRTIDQISDVVQSNSATSQESSAASEELFAQAQTLKELVNNFKLETEH